MSITTKMMNRSQRQIRHLLRVSEYKKQFVTVSSTNYLGCLGNSKLESFVSISDGISTSKVGMDNGLWTKKKSGHCLSFSSKSGNPNENPFWKGVQKLLSLQTHDNYSREKYKEALEWIEQFPEYESNQVCDWERMYEVLKPSESQFPFVCQLLVYTLAHYYGHTKNEWSSCLKLLEEQDASTQSLANIWLKMEAKWYAGKFSELINETGPVLLAHLQQLQNDAENNDNDSDNDKKLALILSQTACVYNAMAISHLINNSTGMKDSSSSLSAIEEAKEWLSKSEYLLSQHYSNDRNNAQLALVKSNSIILHILQQKQELTTIVDDHGFDAIKHWEEALNQLPSSKENNNGKNGIIDGKTHIYSNMVYYLLHENSSALNGKLSENDLQLASKYAKDALDLASSFESDDSETKIIMKRPLWNIAQCYAKTGASAITAEGLYKSCLEDYVNNNNNNNNDNNTWQQVLLNATIQQEYAAFLTKSFDNRASEASIHSKQSQTFSSSLPSSIINMDKPLNAWYSYLSFISL